MRALVLIVACVSFAFSSPADAQQVGKRKGGSTELNIPIDRDGDGLFEFIRVTPAYDGTATGDTQLDLQAALDSLDAPRKHLLIAPGTYTCPDDVSALAGCLSITTDDTKVECEPGAIIRGRDVTQTAAGKPNISMEGVARSGVVGCEIDGGLPYGTKGTVSSATTDTVTDSTASWATNQWQLPTYGDQFVLRPNGPNREVREIVSNTADTVTLDGGSSWSVAPSAGDEYHIGFDSTGILSGTDMGLRASQVTDGYFIGNHVYGTRHACIYQKDNIRLRIDGNLLRECGGQWDTQGNYGQPAIYSYCTPLGGGSIGTHVVDNVIYDSQVGINSRCETADQWIENATYESNVISLTGASSGVGSIALVCGGERDSVFRNNTIVEASMYLSVNSCYRVAFDGTYARGQKRTAATGNPGASLIQNASGLTITRLDFGDTVGTAMAFLEPPEAAYVQGKISWTGLGALDVVGDWNDTHRLELDLYVENAGLVLDSDNLPGRGSFPAIEFQGDVRNLHGRVRLKGCWGGECIEFGGTVANTDLDVVIDTLPTTYQGIGTMPLGVCDETSSQHIYQVTNTIAANPCTTTCVGGSNPGASCVQASDCLGGGTCTGNIGTDERMCGCEGGTWQNQTIPTGNEPIRFADGGAANSNVRMRVQIQHGHPNQHGIGIGRGAGDAFVDSYLESSQAIVDPALSDPTRIMLGLIDLNGETNDADNLHVRDAVCSNVGGNCVEP